MDERLQFVAELCRESGIYRKTGLQDLRSLPGAVHHKQFRHKDTSGRDIAPIRADEQFGTSKPSPRD
jgi:hypothetical protein